MCVAVHMVKGVLQKGVRIDVHGASRAHGTIISNEALVKSKFIGKLGNRNHVMLSSRIKEKHGAVVAVCQNSKQKKV